jgi:predicted O-methyltransferase YrrM
MKNSELYGYYQDFDLGSRPNSERDPKGWSMPAEEAAMLYAVARLVRPKTILELGTHVGYSASCFLKSMNENQLGRLVTLDHKPLLSQDSGLTDSYRVFPLTTDGVEFAHNLKFPIDMVFEDGNHTEEVTGDFLSNCLPHLKSGGVVFVHDVVHPKWGEGVTKGMRRSLGEDFERIVIGASDKGLGFWVKP